MAASERSSNSSASDLIWPFNGGQASWVEDAAYVYTSSKPAMPDILDFPEYSLELRDWWLPRWHSDFAADMSAMNLQNDSEPVQSLQVAMATCWKGMSTQDARLLDAMYRLFPAVIIDVNYSAIVDQERILMSNGQHYKGIVPFYFKIDTFVELMFRNLRNKKWPGKQSSLTHKLVDALCRIFLNAVGFVHGYGKGDDCTMITGLTPRRSLQEASGPLMTLKAVKYDIEFRLLGSLRPGEFVGILPKFSVGCRPFALRSRWKVHVPFAPATRWLRWNKEEGCFFGQVPKSPSPSYCVEFRLEQVCSHSSLKVSFQKTIFLRLRLNIQGSSFPHGNVSAFLDPLAFKKRLVAKSQPTIQSRSNLSLNISNIAIASGAVSPESSSWQEIQTDEGADSAIGTNPSDSDDSGGLSAIIETTQDHRDEESIEWDLRLPKVRKLGGTDFVVPVTSSSGEYIFDLDESEELSAAYEMDSRDSSAGVVYYQSNGSPVRHPSPDDMGGVVSPPSTPRNRNPDNLALFVCTPQGKKRGRSPDTWDHGFETHILPSPLSIIEDQIEARFKHRNSANLADSPSGWALSDSDEQEMNGMF